MIIKSMSRKNPSFAQLLDYIDRDSLEKDFFVFNLYGRDRQSIKREFFKNSKYIKKRKNGIYLYHDIISLEESRLGIDKQKRILRDLVEKYVLERFPKAMVFGKLHIDNKNLHFHLLVSANELRNGKKIRISKSEFNSIQKKIEQYKLQQYPELEDRRIYSKPRDYSKPKSRESELKNRTKKPSKTDFVKDKLEDILNRSQTKNEFFRNLSANGFELYSRGKTFGIKNLKDGIKYRLKRLGLEKEVLETLSVLDRTEERKKELFKAKRYKAADPIRERDTEREKSQGVEREKTEEELKIARRKAELEKSKDRQKKSRGYDFSMEDID